MPLTQEQAALYHRPPQFIALDRKGLSKLKIGDFIKIFLSKDAQTSGITEHVREKCGALYAKVTFKSSDIFATIYCYYIDGTTKEAHLGFGDATSIYEVVRLPVRLGFQLIKERNLMAMTKEEQDKFVASFEADIDKIEDAINKAFAYLIKRYIPEIPTKTASKDLVTIFHKAIALSYTGALTRTAKQNGMSVKELMDSIVNIMTEEAKNTQDEPPATEQE